MYQALFKKSGWGFYEESLVASDDDDARRKVRDIISREEIRDNPLIILRITKQIAIH